MTYARVISLGVLPVVVDRWIREKLIHPSVVMAADRPTMNVSASTDGDPLDTPPGGDSLHEEASANIGQAIGDVPPTPVLSNAQIAQLSATDPTTPFVATHAFELKIQGQIDQFNSTNLLVLNELRSMNTTMSVFGKQLDTMERSHPVRDPLASKLPYSHDDVYRPTLSTASKTSARGAPLFTSTPVVDPAQHVTYNLSDIPVPMSTFTQPQHLNPVTNAVGVGAISKVPTVTSPAPSMVAPSVPPVSDHANSMRSTSYKQGGEMGIDRVAQSSQTQSSRTQRIKVAQFSQAQFRKTQFSQTPSSRRPGRQETIRLARSPGVHIVLVVVVKIVIVVVVQIVLLTIAEIKVVIEIGIFMDKTLITHLILALLRVSHLAMILMLAKTICAMQDRTSPIQSFLLLMGVKTSGKYSPFSSGSSLMRGSGASGRDCRNSLVV